MEIIGYAGAIVMGLLLGLVGGGGAILALPILLYVFGVAPEEATLYTLFIVGVTSFFGSIRHLRQGNFDAKMAVQFGGVSVLSVTFTRLVLLPLIPDVLLITSDWELTKSLFLLLIFAIIMLIVAHKMILDAPLIPTNTMQHTTQAIAIRAVFVGILTGLVGAGGGFLIVPALHLFAHLDFKKAIGTSLLIIAANSLVGFMVSKIGHTDSIDWTLLLSFSAFAVLGIEVGAWLTRFVSGAQLKPIFGWLILIMGSYIIIKTLIAS